MEINARICIWHGLDFGSQLEIPEIRAVNRPCVEEVGPIAVGHNLAVNPLERALVLTRLPAIERFAIEQLKPIGGVLRPGITGYGCSEQHREDLAARQFGHPGPPGELCCK